MVKYITPIIPQHFKYVEVFGGVAHLLFYKQPSQFEVYNDVNKSLVNLWTVIKTPSMLEQLKELLYYTPYSRKNYTKYNNHILLYPDQYTVPDVGYAWAWIVRVYQCVGSIGGTTKTLRQGSFGIAHEGNKPPKTFTNLFSRLDELSSRLLQVNVEFNDFQNCIEFHDSQDTLFYCDPPYILDGDTRSIDQDCRYNYEFTYEDHYRLYKVLSRAKSKVILSYYGIEFIRELYKGWNILEINTKKSSNIRDKGFECPNISEFVITNF